MSVDLVRIVDSIHRDKNIPKEVLFEGIESALATAAKKHYPDAEDIPKVIEQRPRPSYQERLAVYRATGRPAPSPDRHDCPTSLERLR